MRRNRKASFMQVYRLNGGRCHRNMLKGGIFMYPPTLNHPGGKLRLLYECNPLSFIVEQAGGASTDGRPAHT